MGGDLRNAVAVSVPGQAGKLCEDASGVHLEGHVNIIVVADGLGSTGRGADASRLAVKLTLEGLLEGVMGGATPEWLAAHLHAIFAESTAGDPAQATTCQAFLVTPAEGILIQVGDGLAAVRLRTGELLCPQSGRGAFANETDALPRTAPTAIAWPIKQVEAVLLATDGVADDLKEGSVPALLSGFTDMLRQKGASAAEDAITAWLTHWKTPNSNDDRSVALWVADVEH